ncbi:DUF1365 domain-containing protein [Paraburkholderia sp. MMS20-SJTR3]|uniref:DUF1365 domain-containing protein n=1 Tax=Paraburkholderia sejongensis TaxID=2886946 RepID=A0ABS8JMW4_9BURK|nr:DUF1365 domain-containing protein [Paraburkholderia sp. MMS20-SJTR3]MCC8391095.1 DUF1365 domain-containing protein [Paraburkholderia sp. MMS20-SJTR3]
MSIEASCNDGNDGRDGIAARILTGNVMHERLRPARHRFVYPVLYLSCNLACVTQLQRWWFGIDRWAPLGLVTRDYGPHDGQPLESWMRRRLAEAGVPADGDIWLQTIPRVLGYAFSPVSFWFCYDREGALRALYADVRNTFGARHGYLLSAPDHAPIGDDTELICRKTFHVSPFCDVTGHYAFRVRLRDGSVVVAIDYHDRNGLLLRTALALRGEPLSARSALRAVARRPFAALAVMMHIHWQALRLWLKRVPFYGARPPGSGHADRSGPCAPASIPRRDKDGSS